MLAPGRLIELQIDRLATGGAGVGRFEGLVVFVPLAAPGDRVRARTLTLQKNFAEAELVEVLNPGPSRRVAPCPYYGTCGGCNWQHIDETEQRHQKDEIVRSTFLRAKLSPMTWLPLEASPLPFHYRNRIQLHRVHGKLGYRKRRSHDIVAIEKCLIADEELNQSLSQLAKHGASDRIELLKTKDGDVKVFEEAGNHSAIGFSQVNTLQNEKLIRSVLKHASESSHSMVRILDLYCGSGNFSFPLAQKFPNAQVIGVDLNSPGIELAQTQARELGLEKRVQFLCRDVHDFLRSQRESLAFDLILIDPPRTGCSPEVARALAHAKTELLFYISCNPQTLVRDLKHTLTDWDQILSVQPFDMFPQTDHIEVLTVIRRAAQQFGSKT